VSCHRRIASLPYVHLSSHSALSSCSFFSLLLLFTSRRGCLALCSAALLVCPSTSVSPAILVNINPRAAVKSLARAVAVVPQVPVVPVVEALVAHPQPRVAAASRCVLKVPPRPVPAPGFGLEVAGFLDPAVAALALVIAAALASVAAAAVLTVVLADVLSVLVAPDDVDVFAPRPAGFVGADLLDTKVSVRVTAGALLHASFVALALRAALPVTTAATAAAAATTAAALLALRAALPIATAAAAAAALPVLAAAPSTAATACVIVVAAYFTASLPKAEKQGDIQL